VPDIEYFIGRSKRTKVIKISPQEPSVRCAFKEHGGLPRTENDRGNSWKRLSSSLGLARDDDDDDDAVI